MQRIYVDLDDTVFDFRGPFQRELERNPSIKFPHSQYGFFTKLEPIEGSLNALWQLNKMYDVWIATAPSLPNPMCYTEKRVSVEKHLGMYWVERLIICPNKGLLIGDYLIDDNIKGKGQEGFKGQLIQYGSSQFPNWNAVLDFLT